MKYQEGLHGYVRRELVLFEVKNLDDAVKNALFIEAEGGKLAEFGGVGNPKEGTKKQRHRRRKTSNTAQSKDNSKNHCSYCDLDRHTKAKCWILHPKNRKKASKKVLTNIERQELECDCDTDEKITCLTM